MKHAALISCLVLVTNFSNAQCIESNLVGTLVETGSYEIGQSFVAQCSGALQYVEFFSSTSTTISGTLKVSNGNGISASPIYTQVYTNVPVNANGPAHIDLTGVLNLFGGLQYTVSMNMSGAIQYGAQNPYPGGRIWLATSNVPQYASRDLNFILSVDQSCTPSNSSIVETVCFNYTSPSGMLWETSGMYNDTIFNAAGCDSIIVVDLTVNTVDRSVTNNGSTLTANAVDATYQWMSDCFNNFDTIPGATEQTYTPTMNGVYAVWVTANGCTDLSDCIQVLTTGMQGRTRREPTIYPNPGSGEVNITCEGPIEHMAVFNSMGELVEQRQVNADRTSLSGLAPGFYVVSLTQGGAVTRSNLVVY